MSIIITIIATHIVIDYILSMYNRFLAVLKSIRIGTIDFYNSLNYQVYVAITFYIQVDSSRDSSDVQIIHSISCFIDAKGTKLCLFFVCSQLCMHYYNCKVHICNVDSHCNHTSKVIYRVQMIQSIQHYIQLAIYTDA